MFQSHLLLLHPIHINKYKGAFLWDVFQSHLLLFLPIHQNLVSMSCMPLLSLNRICSSYTIYTCYCAVPPPVTLRVSITYAPLTPYTRGALCQMSSHCGVSIASAPLTPYTLDTKFLDELGVDVSIAYAPLTPYTPLSTVSTSGKETLVSIASAPHLPYPRWTIQARRSMLGTVSIAYAPLTPYTQLDEESIDYCDDPVSIASAPHTPYPHDS